MIWSSGYPTIFTYKGKSYAVLDGGQVFEVIVEQTDRCGKEAIRSVSTDPKSLSDRATHLRTSEVKTDAKELEKKG